MSQRFPSFLVLVLVLAGISSSDPAFAQAPSSSANTPIIGAPIPEPQQTAPATDPAQQPAYVDPSQQQPVYVDPSQQQPVYVDPSQQQPAYVNPSQQPTAFVPFNRPRVRYGVTILGGPSVPSGGGSAGGFGGAAARLGVQINRMWGVYYHAQAVIGGYGLITSTGTTTNVFMAVYNTFAGSVTLFDRLDLGFGPSFDAIASMSAKASNTGGGSASVSVLQGTAFGLHAHAGILLGRLDPNRISRSGFSITVDLHPTFIDGRVLMTTAIGLGGEWY